MNRRAFLRTVGGTGIIFAASAVGLTQCDQMPKEAISAWQGPNNQLEDREWILSHALLAPNPHNMQAWVADLTEDNAITLFVDGTRLLPDTDPYARQIIIGQGTFLELLSIAARERGFDANISLFHEGEPATDQLDVSKKPIAHIKLTPTAYSKDQLFSQIRLRRSNKQGYLPKTLEKSHHETLSSMELVSGQKLGFALGELQVDPYRKIAAEAMLLEMNTPRTLRESVIRTRIGADEIAKHRDGIDLHGPMFYWLKKFGAMDEKQAMTPGTMAHQGGIDYALGWAKDTYNMGWLITESNSRSEQVNAGRSYVRLNLLATKLGVSIHPVSQVLQEYPEMTELQKTFNQNVGVKNQQRVQMFFRIGYQDQAAPSPRRRLADIVKA
ncbi:hypothetical protein A9Q83_02390 [Alphaproteobacteria bacterium 46_93_T64]|nr:hypothetical protein A9Q83_02390 [Alphaproteobacteria bacterium 46_93_T64]